MHVQRMLTSSGNCQLDNNLGSDQSSASDVPLHQVPTAWLLRVGDVN